MGSTNPIFILPGALRESKEQIAAGLYASFTLGGGQFCTKPGMVFLPDGGEASEFRDRLEELVDGASRFHLLTEAIRSSYRTGIQVRKAKSSVEIVAGQDAQARDLSVPAALFVTDAAHFLKDPELAAEIFGPATLLVHHSRQEEILEIARNLEGHLTATIHGTEQDLTEARELIRILERKVGRLIFNGFPTGVEVCHAMVHGGPFPATSDGRSTSVGTQAIYRFTRPVCYQGFPNAELPDELKDENPLGIWRLVDGELTRGSLTQPQPATLAG
jgi:NADP-dependent aldehyde dehydrogenase